MNPATRLQELREAIEEEYISYAEIIELQDLAQSNPELFFGDPLLAEWAGIPEGDYHQMLAS
jgi:hypothetical protein